MMIINQQRVNNNKKTRNLIVNNTHAFVFIMTMGTLLVLDAQHLPNGPQQLRITGPGHRIQNTGQQNKMLPCIFISSQALNLSRRKTCRRLVHNYKLRLTFDFYFGALIKCENV